MCGGDYQRDMRPILMRNSFINDSPPPGMDAGRDGSWELGAGIREPGRLGMGGWIWNGGTVGWREARIDSF
jgi:hypothetical protein